MAFYLFLADIRDYMRDNAVSFFFFELIWYDLELQEHICVASTGFCFSVEKIFPTSPSENVLCGFMENCTTFGTFPCGKVFTPNDGKVFSAEKCPTFLSVSVGKVVA